jgi:uncharacterized protein (TIGR03000 family)
MRHLAGFLALAALTLSCWLGMPSKSYAQWFGWGPGTYGWGGYRSGGWGWGGYAGTPRYGSYLTAPNPSYSYASPGYNAMTNYYATPNYYTTTNYPTAAAAVEPVYITTAAATVATPASQDPRPGRAYIYVDVPEDAQVMLNNTAMHTPGSRRVYRTPPLLPNETGYGFEVTARWKENGKEHRETRHIQVTPGGTTAVNFLADQNRVLPASFQGAPAPAAPPRSPGDRK